MKIVFDESGNTGCVISQNNKLNFGTQPNFALCGVVIRSIEDENVLILKYRQFLDRHGIVGEIKGSDLMKRENNALLFDFIENVLDDRHFSFNVYNKKFYLSSLLCSGILGYEFQLEFASEFYNEVSAIAFEPDDFFINYCEFIKDINVESLRVFFRYLLNYKFAFLPNTEQVLLMMVERILLDSKEESWLPGFLTYDWYENVDKVNVINLTALGELIETIKRENPGPNNLNITIVHDMNQEFETLLIGELSPLGGDSDLGVTSFR
jgi:hypothetical protein